MARYAQKMNRVLPVLSLCVALVALALSVMPKDAPLPPLPIQPQDPRLGDDVLELKKRVELLEDDSRNLWDRMVLLERRGVNVSDGGVDPTLLTEVLKLRDEVHALSSGPGVFSNDAGRAALADLVMQVQADQARERAIDRASMRQQKAGEFAEKWKSFMGDSRLSTTQQRALEDRLAREESSRKEAFQRDDGAFPVEAMRTMLIERRETDKLMKGQLDEAQFDAYMKLRREERNGGGGNRQR